jgi:thymidylate kinase
MSCTSEKWVPALFNAWEAAGINYVVLRNYDKLPEDTGNDLDVLVDPVRIGEAEQILVSVLQECGGVLHNCAEFSPVSLFFHDPQTKEQFHVDLFRDLKWRGFDLLRAEHVLANARDFRGMRVPAETDEAVLNLLTRLVFGCYVRDKYKESVRSVFNARSAEVEEILSLVLGSKGPVVLAFAKLGEWGEIEKMCRSIQLKLVVRAMRFPLRTAGTLLFDTKRLIARWISVPGLSIVLMGSDGCGKTSVGVDLKKRLAGTFYEGFTSYLHWKPRLMKGKADAANPFGIPCTDPHGKPGRNPVMNALYFLAHSLEIPPAWLLRVRPRLFRNMLVMIDRYYYDFMVDSKRYRMNVSEKWAWFMYRFMPKPDLVFCLTAPTDVIQARKSEVAPEETERQCRAYEKVADRLPYGHVVDTNRPLEQVVDEVESIVLQYLAERVKRRVKSFNHLKA